MGIETALIGYGLSAATASAVTGGLIASGVGALASKVLTPSAPSASKVAALTEADKPKQAATAADSTSLSSKNALAAAATGALAGNNSTLLTGSAGVTSGLNLGTSTLLGQ